MAREFSLFCKQPVTENTLSKLLLAGMVVSRWSLILNSQLHFNSLKEYELHGKQLENGRD